MITSVPTTMALGPTTMVAPFEVMVKLVDPKVKVEPPTTTSVIDDLGARFEDWLDGGPVD
jgi:hypothetical protein